MGWVILAAALLAFARYNWLLFHYQKFETRRRLMGCEIARRVLDFMGHSQLSTKELLLDRKDYEGTSLLSAAASARQAVRSAKRSAPRVFSDALRQFRHVLNLLVLPAWAAFFLGMWNPAFGFAARAGFFVLGTVFFFGILDFARDVEWQRETLDLLKKTTCFEPDEIIKLRRLLEALQLEGLAQILKVPYEFIAGWPAKKRKNRNA